MARIDVGELAGAGGSRFAEGRVHSVETMGTVDGPGIRLVVFVQGCPMRCAYCHNPDTWDVHAGSAVTVERIQEIFEGNRQFYRSGGVTVSGGEPLLQPDFVADLFAELHARPRGRVHTCLDTSGGAYDPARPERFSRLLDECDLVLLDVKHADADAHRELVGMGPERVLAFGDELCRRGIKVVIRHVVVPGWTDSEEECARLGELIAPWTNVVGLEMLPYHTMGVAKYEALGMPYRLEGVEAMDRSRIPALRAAVLEGMRRARSASGDTQGTLECENHGLSGTGAAN